MQKSLDLSKKTSNRHLIFAKLTRSEQKYTKSLSNLSKTHHIFNGSEPYLGKIHYIVAGFVHKRQDLAKFGGDFKDLVEISPDLKHLA